MICSSTSTGGCSRKGDGRLFGKMMVTEREEGCCAHLLRGFCALSLLFELRVDGLLLLLHELCLPEE